MNPNLSPPVLIIGGAAIFVGFILLRNQSPKEETQEVTSLGESANTNPATGPVGGTYSYLDGTGMQHIVATDPNGNLQTYNVMPPNTSTPYAGQLSSYVGSMSTQMQIPSYMGFSPYYAGVPTQN